VYKGLFQINEDYCKTGLEGRNVPKKYLSKCKRQRQDPDVNILAAASQLQRFYDIIQDRCDKSCLNESITMLYAGHNDGIGVLRNHLLNLDGGRPACNADEIKRALYRYYRVHSNLSESKGMRKLKTTHETILPFAGDMGTTSITIQIPKEITDVSCPLNLSKPIFDLL